jgi:hypothetical protein
MLYRHCFSILPSNIPLERSRERKLNGTHQSLTYADEVNLLGDNIGTIKTNTETLIDAIKEVALEIKVETIKYMSRPFMSYISRYQNIGEKL